MKIEKNISLSSFTSWLVGGVAEQFCLPASLSELKEALQYAQQEHLAITVLGGGSNVLISDDGIAGLTIGLKNLTGVRTEIQGDRFVIEAMAGTSKSELLKIFLKNKLPPALFLAGLPGDIGGGVVMNAGVAEAFTPREFVEIIDWIEVLRPEGSVHRLQKKDLQWNYRHCEGWKPGIIVRVGLSCKNVPDDQILVQVKAANHARLSKQPLDMPSCGSVFVNPPGHKAAQLIDSCGLKGYTFGNAQVSLKHANFIVNLSKATSQEIWSVIEHVKKIVKEKTGVELKTEVVRLGRWQQQN
jgi:UDP-N-acetylmuramate dehydrogenase